MTDKKKDQLAKREKAGLAKGRTRSSKSAFLAKVRASKAAPPATPARLPTTGDPALIAVALQPRKERPRLVLAIDATASREPAWEASKATTDALFEACPGELDVALAVHGGSHIKLFTDFTSKPAALRDQAAAIRCEGGITRLVEIMARCRDVGASPVKVLVYIGDVFEESVEEAEQVAAALRLRGTRVIVLHDRAQAPALDVSAETFQRIAKLTHGAVLPFDATSIRALRELLEALAALAVGGLKLLQARTKALPAATLLLSLLVEGD